VTTTSQHRIDVEWKDLTDVEEGRNFCTGIAINHNQTWLRCSWLDPSPNHLFECYLLIEENTRSFYSSRSFIEFHLIAPSSILCRLTLEPSNWLFEQIHQFTGFERNQVQTKIINCLVKEICLGRINLVAMLEGQNVFFPSSIIDIFVIHFFDKYLKNLTQTENIVE